MVRSSDARRREFIDAAAREFEKCGLAKTTIGDVTDSLGVTRSLFYHYFKDKEDLVDAVIDAHVDDFIEHVHQWMRTDGSQTARERLSRIVPLIRTYLMHGNPLQNFASMEKNENAALLHQFSVRTANRMSKRYKEDVLKPDALVYSPRLAYPRETFYLLVVGMISLFNQERDLPDDVIVDLIISTLHIDR